MASIDLRTLAGTPGTDQHLVEFHVGPAPVAVAPLAGATDTMVFVFNLKTPPLLAQNLTRRWQLDAESLLGLRLATPLHLQGTSRQPAHALVWRFSTSNLPPGLVQSLALEVPFGAAVVGPRSLAVAEANLLLGLRSCPVAPELRPYWAGAKLIEFLTLLPSRSASPAVAATPPSVELPAPVRAALALMHARLGDPLGLDDLATAAGLSPAHFSRVFTDAVGRGPTAHLRRLRMDHAARLLASGSVNVTEAALAAGYQSLGQFSRVFSEHHGRPPSAFLGRNNAQTSRKDG